MENVSQFILFPVTSIIRSELPEEVRDSVQKARSARLKRDAISDALKRADQKLEGKEVTEAHTTVIERLKEEQELEAKAYTEACADFEGKLPAKLLQELEFFGTQNPSDDIAVYMKLGGVLFDLYLRMSPEPQSPLGKLVWRKKSMELAEVLDKEDFSIPEWSIAAMRKALLDDDIWKNTSLSVWCEVSGAEGKPEKRFFSINSRGTQHFGKVLTACAEALYTDELLK